MGTGHSVLFSPSSSESVSLLVGVSTEESSGSLVGKWIL